MDEEERALIHEFKGELFETQIISESLGIQLKKFKRGRKTIAIARAGMGTVNAALTVALIADKIPVEAVMLLGVGGALATQLRIGEMVISSQVIQHDYFSSLDDGHFRMKPGGIVLNAQDAAGHSVVSRPTPSWWSGCAFRCPTLLCLRRRHPFVRQRVCRNGGAQTSHRQPP